MVTLEEAKIHLHLMAYHASEDGSMEPVADPEIDQEVQQLIDAAISHLDSIDIDLSGDPIPPALRHAILMLVGHFDANREGAHSEQVFVTPIGISRLVAPFRKVTL